MKVFGQKTQGLGSSHLTRAFCTEVSWAPVVAPYVRCRKSYLIFANLASLMEKIEQLAICHGCFLIPETCQKQNVYDYQKHVAQDFCVRKYSHFIQSLHKEHDRPEENLIVTLLCVRPAYSSQQSSSLDKGLCGNVLLWDLIFA